MRIDNIEKSSFQRGAEVALTVAMLAAGCNGPTWRPPPLFPVNGDSTQLGPVHVMLVDGREIRLADGYLVRDSLIGRPSGGPAGSRAAYPRDSISAFEAFNEPGRDLAPVGRKALVGVLLVGMVVISYLLLTSVTKPLEHL